MNIKNIKEILEGQQISIYFSAVVIAVLVALLVPGTTVFKIGINPALAIMLFVTFLQVPLADLGRAFLQIKFTAALLLANFIFVPFFVSVLMLFLPHNSILELGVLMVLLTPCIDYVVTFSHLGRANSRLLLVATPILLILQMLLLPVYLKMFLGAGVGQFIKFAPFAHAFVWLIAIPFVSAVLMQHYGTKNKIVQRAAATFGLLAVPATALVLFVVIIAVVPQLGYEVSSVLRVVPIYITFAFFAPLIGWFAAKIFKLEVHAARAVAFSAATRNSLVILPLALAVPHAVPLLSAIIITQTLIELISELVYVRFIAKFGAMQSFEALQK